MVGLCESTPPFSPKSNQGECSRHSHVCEGCSSTARRNIKLCLELYCRAAVTPEKEDKRVGGWKVEKCTIFRKGESRFPILNAFISQTRKLVSGRDLCCLCVRDWTKGKWVPEGVKGPYCSSIRLYTRQCGKYLDLCNAAKALIEKNELEAFRNRVLKDQDASSSWHLDETEMKIRSILPPGWADDYKERVVIPSGAACNEASRKEGGNWVDSSEGERDLSLKPKVIFCGVKPRTITTTTSAQLKLKHLHKHLYNKLSSRYAWLNRGEFTKEGAEAIIRSHVANSRIINGDYSASTDNIRIEYVQMVLRVILETAGEAVTEEMKEIAQGIYGQWTRGSPMGNYLSFVILCLLNWSTLNVGLPEQSRPKVNEWKYPYQRGRTPSRRHLQTKEGNFFCVDDARLGGYRINGDDIAFRGNLECEQLWRYNVDKIGFVINDSKTSTSQWKVELNSTEFTLTHNKIKKTFVPGPAALFAGSWRSLKNLRKSAQIWVCTQRSAAQRLFSEEDKGDAFGKPSVCLDQLILKSVLYQKTERNEGRYQYRNLLKMRAIKDSEAVPEETRDEALATEVLKIKNEKMYLKGLENLGRRQGKLARYGSALSSSMKSIVRGLQKIGWQPRKTSRPKEGERMEFVCAIQLHERMLKNVEEEENVAKFDRWVGKLPQHIFDEALGRRSRPLIENMLLRSLQGTRALPENDVLRRLAMDTERQSRQGIGSTPSSSFIPVAARAPIKFVKAGPA